MNTTTASDIWALVPVKRFSHAKTRLASILSPGQRHALARAMLEDVLATLAATPALAGRLVITDDPEAAALAHERGADVMRAEEAGYNEAVAVGLARLRAEGRRGALVVPADVPLATTAEIEAVVEAFESREIVLVPATGDGGTNAFLVTPGRFAPAFGPNSFARHRAAALSLGIVPAEIACPGLGRDVDRPDDLSHVLASGEPGRARDVLMTLDLSLREAVGA